MSTSHAARIAATAVALALPLSLLTATSAVAAPTVVTDWVELQTAFAAPSTDTVIVLGADITAPEDESLLMDSTSTLVLDLSSFTLTIGPAADELAAVGVPEGADLTIQTAEDGSLVAQGGNFAAGIGGGDRVGVGSITIAGGSITATGGGFGAGIGSGFGSAPGALSITGGTVTATGGTNAAGIGGGWGGPGATATISGALVTATGGFRGAGIGGGLTGSGGTTTITSGTVVATGGDYASGIGGGSNAQGGTTVIDGGTVTAISQINGAGIGGGLEGRGVSTTINGGDVTAEGGRYGAGIGGGYRGAGGTIEIHDGTVAATAGDAGAGIGGGFLGRGGSTTITGGTIAATGSDSAAGIGGGSAIGGYAGLEGTLAVTGAPAPGSATTGSGTHGSVITNPTQPAGVRYLAVATTDDEFSYFSLDYVAIISFDTAGGSAVADAAVPLGTAASAPAAPSRPGFVFAGWVLDDEPYDFGTAVTESLTLTATWTALAVYRVSFDAAGGTLVADQNVFDGAAASEPAAPSRTGFLFAGWLLNETPYDFSTPVTGPVALTASWTTVFYRVSFDPAGGTPVADQEIAAGGVVAQPPAPARDGYVFAGWSLDSEPYDFSTSVGGPFTLTAVWTLVPAPEPTTERLSGAGRYATAVAISKETFASGADTVFIATGTGFADALSAAPAAASEGAPLLLTQPTILPTVVKNEILRLNPSRVVIVGSAGAVSTAVENAIRGLSIAPAVRRVSGPDRFATSRAIAEAFFDSADNGFIATGLNFPDALAAGPAAAELGGPVILVPGVRATVDAATLGLLDRLDMTTVYLAGSTRVVSAGIENQLDALPGVAVQRLSGADRYSTAVAINDAVFDTADRAYISTGLNFADALGGGAAAANQGAPLYITPPRCVAGSVMASITRLRVSTIYILGGPTVLSNEVEKLTTC